MRICTGLLLFLIEKRVLFLKCILSKAMPKPCFASTPRMRSNLFVPAKCFGTTNIMLTLEEEV
jgi:hypothetical protein